MFSYRSLTRLRSGAVVVRTTLTNGLFTVANGFPTAAVSGGQRLYCSSSRNKAGGGGGNDS